eukprot:gene4884-5524_t
MRQRQEETRISNLTSSSRKQQTIGVILSKILKRSEAIGLSCLILWKVDRFFLVIKEVRREQSAIAVQTSSLFFREDLAFIEYTALRRAMNNNIGEDWMSVKPRIESSLRKLRCELEELRNADKDLLKKFIKMRSEIKELSKDAAPIVVIVGDEVTV